MTDQNTREAWEDEIDCFVPAFAPVQVTQINAPNFSASMVLNKQGKLAIQMLDEDETQEMTFEINDLLNFVPQDVVDGPWEQYIGLIEVAQQFEEFAEKMMNKVDEVRDIMYEKDMPGDLPQSYAHLRVIREQQEYAVAAE